MTSRQIRQQFLDFFASKRHAYVPSSPVVPHDDPTLMFTNAGMNQFKPIFLGTESPKHLRVANSQKCIRAGGKHNDLDDVGQDTYHHTFFEMLGNWSFGDYFKKEAIEWAWELLTKVCGIDKSRLHATYFRGDPAEGLEPDSEAAELWRTVTDIDPTHIHPGNKKDNFWEMGDTGPCGPCSEIHIDLTPDRSGSELVNRGDARVIEIWNLVFIQFNRGSDGKLTPLPAKHVDTGMGFERLCAVLQKKTSNYDTDVFTPIFEAIRKRTGASTYKGTLPEPRPSGRATQRPADSAAGSRGLKPAAQETDNRQSTIMVDVSYRVIADHLRCLVFALSDGAIPSNEGRGYVLRRILRRAVRYGRQYMNMHEPFLCDLVPTVVEHMGDVFPELRVAHLGKNIEHMSNLIREEETSFLKTLDRGIKFWNRAALRAVTNALRHGVTIAGPLPRAGQSGWRSEVGPDEFAEKPDSKEPTSDEELYDIVEGHYFSISTLTSNDVRQRLARTPIISGEDAFRLHDTYGFPIDLTELMAKEQEVTVDICEYERLLEAARERSRGEGVAKFSAISPEAGFFLGHRWTGTDDSEKYSRLNIDDATVDGWVNSVGDASSPEGGNAAVNAGDTAALVLNKTCFYSEQGGQVGDRGVIRTHHATFVVEQTAFHQGTVLHIGRLQSGALRRWDRAECEVDRVWRRPIMQNHTATHVLNWALREVLGEHVQQKGSLVDPEKTRFDFSHNHALSGEELSRIERLVKNQIGDGLEVNDLLDGKREVPQKAAREINTLRAVFGEKYPDMVRVVSIGANIEAMLSDPKNPKWMKYSVEFCGGTHLKNSKETEEFVLVHEEAVAKGVRRLVALTAEKAREAMRRGEEFLEIAEALRRGQRPLADQPPVAPKHAHASVGMPPGGPYDLARLLRELSEATIPILTRHQLAGQIAVLQESAKEHQKQASAQAQRGAVEAVGDLLAANSLDVGGVTVVVGEVPGAGADALRSGIDYVRNKKGSSAVLLATIEDGKVTLVAGMSKDLVERGIKAGDLIKEICPLVGGKGGGRPDMAQGGGTEPTGLAKALDKAREWIAAKLGA